MLPEGTGVAVDVGAGVGVAVGVAVGAGVAGGVGVGVAAGAWAVNEKFWDHEAGAPSPWTRGRTRQK